jgi:amidase
MLAFRRSLPILSLLLFAARGFAQATTGYDVEEKSIGELRRDLDAGKVTSEQLVRAYLARIEKIDRAGPTLHSVLALNPKVIEQAQALDRERKQKKAHGPLHGIPVLLKDNIETMDPMPTTAGSLALKDNFAVHDAPLAAQLRAAGAVILGKTNLSEWANFRSNHSVSGWSGVGGLTRNAYATDRSACGSSSGTGSAIAASLAAAGVGSETDGSVTCPASMVGLVGLKPTLGLISGDRVIPIAHSQDTAGPMTRNVTDTALLLQAMATSTTLCKGAAADCKLPNYTAALAPDSLRGKRIGVLRFPEGRQPELDEPYNAALKVLKDAGAVLVETELPASDILEAAELQVLLSEFKTDLNAYLATTPPAVKSRTLEDLIAFNKASPTELKIFGQDIFITAQATEGTAGEKYRQALETSKRLAGPEGLDNVLAKDHLDALVAPTTGATWRLDLINGDHYPGSFTTYPAVSGYPHLTVPMGTLHELPLGLSFIGPAWSEPLLLGLGYSFEQKAKSRKPPKYLPSIDGELEKAASRQ